MKNSFFRKEFNLRLLTFGLMAFVLAVLGCQKYADVPPRFDTIDSLKPPVSKRVLVIMVDGLNATAFKQIAPPAYSELLKKGKYAWDAFSDYDTSTAASSWKTILSGVGYNTHQIADSSFAIAGSGSDSHTGGQNQNFPSLFYFLLRTKAYNLNSNIVSAWPMLVQKLGPEAKHAITVGNDKLVGDSIVNLMKTGNPELVVAHFSGPAQAVAAPGSNASYDASSADYKAAVLQADTYIGNIITALKARPGYGTQENWLVVIAGTHGGEGKETGGGTIKDVQVAVVYYNERFTPAEFTLSGLPQEVIMSGYSGNTMVNAVMPDERGGSKFSFGTSGQFTVQYKVKIAGSNGYTNFFAKSSVGTGGDNGIANWTRADNGKWSLRLGSRTLQNVGPTITDNKWHTLTFTIYDSASKRWFKRYIDGARLNEAENTVDAQNRELVTSITNTSPLIFGASVQPGLSTVALNCSMLDLLVYNTALTDAEVNASSCKAIADYPYQSNITGYWPCNDGLSRFANTKNQAQYFNLNGPFTWTILSTLPCTISPASPKPGTKPQQFKLTDVSRQVFYWLGLTPPTGWSYQGSLWLDKYEAEFITE